MGNSALAKFIAPLDIVETCYSSPFEAPIVTLDKEETTLAAHQGQLCLFVNSASGHPDAKAHLDQLQALKAKQPGLQVFLFPSNDFGREPANF
jgi:glutathione peroxidase-family protein